MSIFKKSTVIAALFSVVIFGLSGETTPMPVMPKNCGEPLKR